MDQPGGSDDGGKEIHLPCTSGDAQGRTWTFFGPRNLKELKQTWKQDFPDQDGRPSEELCFDIQAR